MQQINQTDFDQLKQTSNSYAVIDFWAPWCGPCNRMAPLYQIVSETPEFQDKIEFLKIDVDDNPDFKEVFGFRTIPSFYIVKFNSDGKFDTSNILSYLGGSQLPDEMITKIKEQIK